MHTTTRHHKNNIICLIYVLRNRINKKVYIGQTWRSLKERINTGYKGCIYLHNAMTIHGADQFYYEVLCVANTQEIANYWERYFIAKFNSTDSNIGYNLREGGSNGTFPPESRRKMSLVHLGSKRTDEQKEKLSVSKMGNKNPSSKITTEIAREIYTIYHTDLTTSCDSLSERYGIHKSNINNIVNRVSWVDATKDLSIIPRPKNNGKNWTRTKLTPELVKEINQKLATGLYSNLTLGRMYGVSEAAIRLIKIGKNWKHIK